MIAVAWQRDQLFDQSQLSPVAGLQSAHGSRCKYCDTDLRRIKAVEHPISVCISFNFKPENVSILIRNYNLVTLFTPPPPTAAYIRVIKDPCCAPLSLQPF